MSIITVIQRKCCYITCDITSNAVILRTKTSHDRDTNCTYHGYQNIYHGKSDNNDNHEILPDHAGVKFSNLLSLYKYK